ncbi:enoyl-CoA hydratase/isomerase family protein [Candidatus Palauibacter sp.]|uniref:enoyl-CoA hydratase/isomerase family protein n=1 Tax=Candidatus Palauibacter sp. TaxID=3101350 RepID=UPI003D12330E
MIERRDESGTAEIRMTHEPANVLTVEFSDALAAEFERTRADDSVRAVVLTGTESAFSAGVELFRVVDEGPPYVDALLESLGELFSMLRAFPKPLVAAVNGHAVAGGGVIACACDYRVMAAGQGRIGLPELKVGVPFPAVALDIVRATVPRRHQREVMLLGRLYDPEGAAERGLVDEIVAADDLLGRAREIALDLASIPAAAYSLTKRQFASASGGAIDLEPELHSIWTADDTREHIRGYLQRTLGRSSAAR